MVGALAAGEHFDALDRLLANAPRRIGKERLEQRRFRRVLAARDEVGKLDPHGLVAIRKPGAEHRRRRLRGERAAQRPCFMPPYRSTSFVQEGALDPGGDLGAPGLVPPTEEGRRRPGPYDGITVSGQQSPQLPGEAGGTGRLARLRPPGGVDRRYSHCGRPVAQDVAHYLGRYGGLGSQQAVSVYGERTERNVSRPGSVT